MSCNVAEGATIDGQEDENVGVSEQAASGAGFVTSVKPYVVSVSPEYALQPLISSGDRVPETSDASKEYQLVGIPDGIFSFARKLDAKAFQGGWFHWSQRDLKDVGDRGEYSRYLELNGAGDESRQNAEVSQRFFDANGKLKPSAKKSWLTTPRRCWRRAPSAR